MTTTYDEPLITTAMLERWKQEDARLEVEERYIKERRGDLRRLIEAGIALVSPARPGLLSTPLSSLLNGGSHTDSNQPSLPETILKHLESLPQGDKSAGIQQEVKKEERFKKRLESNPNAVYSTLSDLVRSERLKRKGDMYVHPKYA